MMKEELKRQPSMIERLYGELWIFCRTTVHANES